MPAKRRLPLVQEPADAGVPVRPSWQWALFGAGIIVLVWLVLALLTSPVLTWILRRNVGFWGPAEELEAHVSGANADVVARVALESAAAHVVVLGLASLAGGLLVGTWGPKRGVVESACAGALVAAGALALAASTGGMTGQDASRVVAWGGLVLIPWAAGMAALGAWRGSRKKRVLVGP